MRMSDLVVSTKLRIDRIEQIISRLSPDSLEELVSDAELILRDAGYRPDRDLGVVEVVELAWRTVTGRPSRLDLESERPWLRTGGAVERLHFFRALFSPPPPAVRGATVKLDDHSTARTSANPVAAPLMSQAELERIAHWQPGLRPIWETMQGWASSRTMNIERRRRRLPTAEVHLGVLGLEGNPGSGKSSAAFFMAAAAAHLGLVREPKVVSVNASALQGEYTGHTYGKVCSYFEAAIGGLLLIDETESWVQSKTAFAAESIKACNELLETRRGELLVVVTAYPGGIAALREVERGFSSRINPVFRLPDLDARSAALAFTAVCAHRGQVPSLELARQLEEMYTTRIHQFGTAWSNGRQIRSDVDHVLSIADSRRVQSNRNRFTSADLVEIILDDAIDVLGGDPAPIPAFAKAEGARASTTITGYL